MDKEKRWKRIIEVDDFFIEDNGETIRAVDKDGIVINKTNKKQDITNFTDE